MILRRIDNLLNRITMYRLVLYYLIVLIAAGVTLSILHLLPYDPLGLVFTTLFLIAACYLTNKLFAWAFHLTPNVESVYITALIFALIITPPTTMDNFWFVVWMGVLAMASKYVIAFRRKHIFNPVAFGALIVALTLNQTASWWVGSAPMLPLVVIGGLLVVRKLRRFDLVLSFFAGTLITLVFFASHENITTVLHNDVLYSPLFFFAFIILTEPLTTPPTRRLRMIYGFMVGVLVTPEFHIGAFYLTPELAILIGNVYSWLVSPKTRLILTLRDRLQLSPDTWEFSFTPEKQFAFAPGQYMEWTLGHKFTDSRGNRRYFTLASAPTEPIIRLGVKFYPKSSSYKRALLKLDDTRSIVAAQIAGDFTLPDDPRLPLVLIAGGIGITPYRSMLKYLLDIHQPRPITVLYTNKTPQDILYRDVLDQAQRDLGVKVIYTLTDLSSVPADWSGEVGRIDAAMIEREIPDYPLATYYLCGSLALVDGMKALLHQIGIPSSRVKTDYFSGLA